MKQQQYEYTIIGAGIAGCCVAYELSKQTKNQKILLLEKYEDVALGASGAAGAFLSPLLGKPNSFKDLVTKALTYSTNFYQTFFKENITTCGTTRVAQDEEDAKKFQSYIPYMDFEYSLDKEQKNGYFFKIGSVVDSFNLCKNLIKKCTENLDVKFNYEVTSLEYEDDIWKITDSNGNQIESKNIILTTGSDISLVDEFYLKIRAVWGCRIDVQTTSSFSHNYHKTCSLSKTTPIDEKINLVSIGATHHRDKKDVENLEENTKELLEKANDIFTIKDAKVLKHYIGARACSVDYFPLVGEIIDSKKTLEEFPYMVNGTNVEPSRFTRYKNAYILTGVGGRGFVLSPYLAKELVENILNKKEIDSSLTIDRLFKREVKRIK